MKFLLLIDPIFNEKSAYARAYERKLVSGIDGNDRFFRCHLPLALSWQIIHSQLGHAEVSTKLQKCSVENLRDDDERRQGTDFVIELSFGWKKLKLFRVKLVWFGDFTTF